MWDRMMLRSFSERRGELRRVSGGRAWVVEALPAGVCRRVPGVVEVQVVQQAGTGGGGLIQPQGAGGPVRAVGDKQGSGPAC